MAVLKLDQETGEPITNCDSCGIEMVGYPDRNLRTMCEECENKVEEYWESNSVTKTIGGKKMVTIKEAALAYEPKQTLNVADLEQIPVNLDIYDGEGTDKDGKEFSYKYTRLDGKEYRVPATVLEEIQKILKPKPEIEKVRVTKSGSGLGTKYSVDPVL